MLKDILNKLKGFFKKPTEPVVHPGESNLFAGLDDAFSKEVDSYLSAQVPPHVIPVGKPVVISLCKEGNQQQLNFSGCLMQNPLYRAGVIGFVQDKMQLQEAVKKEPQLTLGNRDIKLRRYLNPVWILETMLEQGITEEEAYQLGAKKMLDREFQDKLRDKATITPRDMQYPLKVNVRMVDD